MLCRVEGCSKATVSRGFCWMHYERWRRHGDPLAGRAPDGAGLAFLEEILNRAAVKECIYWPFGTRNRRYGGSVYVDGHYVGVTRYVCECRHGPPPSPEYQAAHNCGHDRCINWSHLRWATARENNADKLQHGTAQRGERHGMAKLTDADVRIIRSEAHKTRAELAREYNVDWSTIDAVLRRQSWLEV